MILSVFEDKIYFPEGFERLERLKTIWFHFHHVERPRLDPSLALLDLKRRVQPCFKEKKSGGGGFGLFSFWLPPQSPLEGVMYISYLHRS